MHSRRFAAAISGLLLMWLAIGVGHVRAAEKLSVGETGAASLSWPSYIAEAKGFYKDQGIDFDRVIVNSQPSGMQQLIAGSLDLFTPNFYNAIRPALNGADVVVTGMMVGKYPYGVMANTSIKTAADLKGKQIMLGGPNELTTIYFGQWLSTQGVSLTQMDRVYDDNSGHRFAALSAGVVQATTLTQPFDIRAEQEGFHRLVDIGQAIKGSPFVVIAANRSWVRGHAQLMKAYLLAVSEATAWFYDPANKNEAVSILARTMKQDPALCERMYNYYQQLQPFSRDMVITDDMLAGTLSVLKQARVVQSSENPPPGFLDRTTSVR